MNADVSKRSVKGGFLVTDVLISSGHVSSRERVQGNRIPTLGTKGLSLRARRFRSRTYLKRTNKAAQPPELKSKT